jgi:hypothetical protein
MDVRDHPKLAWSDEAAGCQCGAGRPCECQVDVGDLKPVILEIITEVKH